MYKCYSTYTWGSIMYINCNLVEFLHTKAQRQYRVCSLWYMIKCFCSFVVILWLTSICYLYKGIVFVVIIWVSRLILSWIIFFLKFEFCLKVTFNVGSQNMACGLWFVNFLSLILEPMISTLWYIRSTRIFGPRIAMG